MRIRFCFRWPRRRLERCCWWRWRICFLGGSGRKKKLRFREEEERGGLRPPFFCIGFLGRGRGRRRDTEGEGALADSLWLACPSKLRVNKKQALPGARG